MKTNYEVVWTWTIRDIPMSEGIDARNGNENKNMLKYYAFEKFKECFKGNDVDIMLSRFVPECYLIEVDKEKNIYNRIKL